MSQFKFKSTGIYFILNYMYGHIICWYCVTMPPEKNFTNN